MTQLFDVVGMLEPIIGRGGIEISDETRLRFTDE